MTRIHAKREGRLEIKKLFFISFLWLSTVPYICGLKCYHCIEKPKSTELHLSCAYFDESTTYHKECTHSTFCMKKASYYELRNGTLVTIYLHKCADQSYKTLIKDEDGTWNWVRLIRKNIFDNGCFTQSSKSLRTTNAVNCFCDTDLCNHSTNVKSHSAIILSSVLFIWISSYLFN